MDRLVTRKSLVHVISGISPVFYRLLADFCILLSAFLLTIFNRMLKKVQYCEIECFS
jgi:hypothetical protein